ncbi:MAG: acyloxyacyl hydrolase, partial [Bacteroidota bacterium]
SNLLSASEMRVLFFIGSTINWLLAISVSGLAQDNTSYAGVKAYTGFIIPHSAELRDVSARNLWGIGLEAGRVLKTEQAWANCNCFSKVGIGANYFNYRNPQELGESYNLTIFGEPYLSFRRNWFLTLRGEAGVSYLTRVYDQATNPRNTFFSSPLSFLILANFTLNYRFQDNYIFRLSANYNHISNGGMRHPNKGMNFPTLSLGVEKHFGKSEFPQYTKQPGLRKRNWYRYLFLGASRRTLESARLHSRTDHLNAGIETGFMRSVTNINAFSTGIELYYNGVQAEHARRYNEEAVPLRWSLMMGHALVFGKFSFTQQAGYHLYQPFALVDKSFFQRYALYYQLGAWLHVGTSLKAYGHVADFMDVRIGTRW